MKSPIFSIKKKTISSRLRPNKVRNSKYCLFNPQITRISLNLLLITFSLISLVHKFAMIILIFTKLNNNG